MQKLAVWIGTIANHPLANFVVGLILFGSGVVEVIQELEQEVQVGSHHGAVVFGLVHTFKSFSHLAKGVQR